MKRHLPRSRPLLDAGGVSATDILMNLFVFFFIAFSLLASFERKEKGAEEHAQPLRLPQSGAGGETQPGALSVELAPARRALLDGRPVAADELTGALREELKQRPRGVVVRADRAMSLGETVEMLDRVWAARPPSVSLATVTPDVTTD